MNSSTPLADTESVIDIRDVVFRYQDEAVLDSVNLQVHRGEFMALLGPNGGGKTTLLKLMLGLLSPEQGTIRVLGGEPGEVKRRIGYVPQHTLFNPGFPMTVERVTLLGITRRKLSPGFGYTRQQVQRAHDALARVDIVHLAKKPIQGLSGGQLQRVLIARALINEPELLIFDEPTSSIDPHGTYCFYEMLSKIGSNLTVVLVSHDISVTAPIIHSVACVNRQLIYNDKPELTSDMLSLMYGVHADSCPMSIYLSDLSQFVVSHQHHVDVHSDTVEAGHSHISHSHD